MSLRIRRAAVAAAAAIGHAEVRVRAAECGMRGAPPPPLANPLFDLEVKAPVNDDKLIKAPTLEQIRAQKARRRESAGVGGYNVSP